MTDADHDRVSPVQHRKGEIRRAARIRRAAIGADALKKLSSTISKEMELLIFEQRGLTSVALYAAMLGEVNLDPLAARLWDAGIVVGFPRVTDPLSRSMVFHQMTSVPNVTRDTPPFREPPPDAPLLENPGLVVVPGLAFDRDGNRLGFGGGYYDHWLTHHPDAFTVGVCASSMVVENVPTEAHDVPVDVVVTEIERYRRASNSPDSAG